MLRALLRHAGFTPQSVPLPQATTPQVENSAGGHSWAVTPWQRLERFLVLGSTAGSYYASPKTLTVQNASAVRVCMAEDGLRTVAVIRAVSEQGRAPRQDPALFALALCLKQGDLATRQAAAEALPALCRTGSQLFSMATAVDTLGGWGRCTRRAFASWYDREDTRSLAYQLIKYRQRDGWTHRDMLRKAHPKPATAQHDALCAWACRGWEGALPDTAPDDALRLAWAYERARQADSAREIVTLVSEHQLVRECIPTHFLAEPEVWGALLHSGGRGMPVGAMLRNLGKLTSVGLLNGSGASLDAVVRTLTDIHALRRARIHPLSVLVALNTYARGRGVRGGNQWAPSARVMDALDKAFELSFQAIEPTGLRWLLAVDVSGSMGWNEIARMTGVTPRVGAAAMAMATARSEPRYDVLAFSHQLVEASVSERCRLDQALAAFDGIPMGGTDCALPMLYAAEHRVPVDVFVVYTDSETWAGKMHPAQALDRYRQRSGIPAKLVICGMVSNGFTIADPDDAGMLDVVGFDSAAPRVMADFARG